uniref:Uncharacterized protein n=1 Tax=Romanomermis culicivorax TaxID=13658 RepID=A0A915JWX1_ROMCU
MVLDEVQMKEKTQDEDVSDLESNDKEGQVIRIMEMDEETFIWTKSGTYIPPNTTTFVQAVVWPQKDWTKGPIVVKEMGKDTLFNIEASILDAKNNEFRILLINDTINRDFGSKNMSWERCWLGKAKYHPPALAIGKNTAKNSPKLESRMLVLVWQSIDYK